LAQTSIKRNRDLKFIGLLKQLSPHGLYKLQEPDGIVFLDESVSAVSGEWGGGISPFSLLTAAIRFYGFTDAIQSEMSGRGFMYNDLLRQLEDRLLERVGNVPPTQGR
jgi:hypothetical protein